MWNKELTKRNEDIVRILYKVNPEITYLEVEEKTGISRRTVPRMFARLGLEKSSNKLSLRKFSGEKELKIIERYKEGVDIDDIKKEFNVGHGHLYEILKRHNVSVRPPRAGDKHPSWKGGKGIDKDGYVRCWMSFNHPFIEMRKADGYAFEHRLVMAEHLGRVLKKNETVHHINGNRADNRIENLQLRMGNHGPGTCFRCNSCGSKDIERVNLDG